MKYLLCGPSQGQGCAPHSFSSWRKRMRRARWKKKPLGAQILPGGRFGQKRGAGERRILAVWAPRWARAGVCGSFKWSARDETPELIRGANRIGFRSSFTVSACGPRSIYSGAKSLATLGCAEYSAAAPSVTSVPLVPPSAGSCGNGAAAGKEADTNSIRTHGAFPRIVAG